MSLFMCTSCRCVENTATSGYWWRDGKPPLCSECDPDIKKWHGVFTKEPAKGYVLLSDGFIATQEYVKTKYFKERAKMQDLKVVEVIE